MNWVIMTTYLGLCSLMDIRKKEINFCFCLCFILAGIVYIIATGRILKSDFFAGIIPGMIFWVLAILLKNHIGVGDAIMILTLGFYFKIEIILVIMFWSFLAAAIVSVVIVVIKRKTKGITVPFAPFLAIGEIGTFIMMWRW